MKLVCLDLEGVLVPEIWISFAEKTGIEHLRLTTRDIPDYDVLMKGRLDILREHGLKLRDIQDVISRIDPLEGALDFLDELRVRTQVVILSDTFSQFAGPLMKKLAWPTLFCNELEVAADGSISGYRLRQKDGKRHAVEHFTAMGFTVFAAGDSYNDLGMITHAATGAFFRAPHTIVEAHPEIPAVEDYDGFLTLVEKFLA
ncbi:bifunctional phosphoserine phosphatase/homoserine phosphotransferase ThrH [Parasphaerochaeta coccoides]|uniref:phosphoserine phosphatase n=1 Tax=Parasphaerochaeta coccoides (strain ATCC BAA-1237 / DSM 17374 / SPN1) TaxID=760011 RepID=F4GH45_PARC1|nr:bifunctional phosphoserine phosphatase/homoserine phosphotransferase ThrH [Parasphaerochaeta coccoides]AEC01520.1 phosphoserine phosphatase/homoserine phosphotransferase bifunctional protein [Parasphaerochaeta coccoides DSM 17374]